MPPAYLTAEHPWDLLDWHEAVDALREGHRQGQPRSADIHLHGEYGDLFSRASGIDGVGYGLKAESLFGGNPARGLPTSQCVMLVFAPDDGRLRAMVDSRVITALKTASDSVLAAGYLAAPGSSPPAGGRRRGDGRPSGPCLQRAVPGPAAHLGVVAARGGRADAGRLAGRGAGRGGGGARTCRRWPGRPTSSARRRCRPRR